MSNPEIHVILDGGYVTPDTIDPAKHRYIGIFRPPAPIVPTGEHRMHCPSCHQIMYTSMGNSLVQHWQKGCFDVPQYQTVKEGAE